MLKPPIVRMGGKSRLRKTIIDMLPEHTCYVELFFGAGWV
ncbi:DNA adenine methylase, partial [Clostridium perfringens]